LVYSWLSYEIKTKTFSVKCCFEFVLVCCVLSTMLMACDNLQHAFLPTMPQDDTEEVRAALLGARHANENPVFYRMHILCSDLFYA